MFEIEVFHPDGRSEVFKADGKVIIGRGDECDITLSSRKVSYIHTEIVERDDGWMVFDAGSTNGTYVNGQRITEFFIKEGQIEVGEYILKLRKVHVSPQDLIKDRIARRIRNFSSWEEAILYAESIAEEENVHLHPDGIRALVRSVFGFEKIADLMEDPSISEIMINGIKSVYVERGGKLFEIPHRFKKEEEIYTFIERVLLPLGKRVDESVPYADARLPDGSRLHVVIPPVSLTGPVITIRKFLRNILSVDDLLRRGSLSRECVDYIKNTVGGRRNIVISGGTGSGKTTLLNVLSSFIPHTERIVTIEDTAELCLKQPHVVSLEARPPNVEGEGEITIRDLVRNALRMRPDRIIVGECRGKEAFDMLQAMNTGHEGSMTTLHANSPRDALYRLESMVMMTAIDVPLRAVRFWISSAVDIVIHTARLSDGKRVVMEVDEVRGVEEEVILMERIFYRDGEKLVYTGYGGRL